MPETSVTSGADTASGCAIPETVPLSAVESFTDEVDVLVVGFGIAGGCAAVQAASDGANVLVLERAAVAGGTTSMAGGHFYLGGGTPVQVATGHEDSPEEMAKYLTAVSRDPEPDKIRAYCQDSVEHFGWLEALGFAFERSYYPEKAVIQPGTEGLMFTGNEKVWPFREQAVPAPRGHKVPVPGDTEGAAMVIDLLVKRCGDLGAEIRYETGAVALVVDDSPDGDGAVVGVRWKRFKETGYIRAGAVVLAAGGFVMNPDMVAAHTPQLAEKPFTLGSTYDDGLGIRMGRSVGGATKHMDQAFVTVAFYPPSSLLKGIIVNKRGERFVAEDSYHSRTSGFVLDQPDAAAYLIVDSEHIEHPKFPLTPFIDGWESVAEMEAGLELPEGSLQRTLERYNEHAARGEDPDFHKHPDWLAPQDAGPWGAFDLSLGKAFYAGFTIGGLAVTVDGQVRREDDSLVPGLYAAGSCASNLAQDAQGYASGTQLGEGSYFGRRAGAAAAARRTR
ncbi:FAD-binding protein [Nocardioides massiliensis]|uniref:Succinate dehydrogenase/fumarate reductase flavoprotein subunit n=1 Tax=Nocardioides massiliensis TaxID=1325935 RepID=A0ABT9NKS0_9ACTN|nr:FAD-binding protein [Nocardioides massiliensis]MDP9821021.1 succinate dehydrogenase/fumarate reductase flavoprotein subunit [Nocardioides massiliensis]